MTHFQQQIAWLFFVCCITSASAQEVADPRCSGLEQNVIYFGNGVKSGWTEAKASRRAIRDSLATVLSGAEINTTCFRMAFNTPQGIALDVLETANQLIGNELPSVIVANMLRAAQVPGIVLTPSLQDKLNNLFSTKFAEKLFQSPASQADLNTQVGNYKRDLTANKKVVVVAHSQGNIFSNLAYGTLQQQENPENFSRFATVNVASPDYRALGALKGWVTFDNDGVIFLVQTLRSAAGVQPALAATDTADGQSLSWKVHDFVPSYLFDPSAKQFILDGIVSTLATLPSSPSPPLEYVAQPSYTGSCLERPPGTVCIGFDDGYILLVTDPAVDGPVNVALYQGKIVQAAAGTNGYYYHVLGTNLVGTASSGGTPPNPSPS